MEPNSERRIGLLAAWGRFPREVALGLKRRGYEVVTLGLQGFADPSLADVSDVFRQASLTRMASHVHYFRRQGVTTITMAGKIHKVELFQRGFLRRHFPDWMCFRTFFPHFVSGTRNRNDDALLEAAVNAYAQSGLRVAAATDLVPELLMPIGQLCGPPLSRRQRQDVGFGWKIAREMGRLDIGQSVAVKGRAVLAVEAIEGTDECIRRAGMLCPVGGFTVVKVAKPQQDMRFDVPTIGVGTIQSLAQAGGDLLIVEAERTILVDPAQVARAAEKHRVSVLALSEHADLAAA